MIDYFSYLLLNKIVLFHEFFYNLHCIAANLENHSDYFGTMLKCSL